MNKKDLNKAAEELRKAKEERLAAQAHAVIAVFNTTYETLRAEDFFRAEKVDFKPVIKPRKIGSHCRMALQFDGRQSAAAKRAVAKGELKLAGFFKKSGDDWTKLA